jgi:hypothetical protein
MKYLNWYFDKSFIRLHHRTMEGITKVAIKCELKKKKNQFAERAI